MSDEHRGRGSKKRGWLGSGVRRTLFAAAMVALVGANAWVVRRQFPPKERRKNQAYDEGLRALTIDLDFEAAEVHFRKYLELEPTQPRIWYLLGVALQSQGDLDGARGAFTEATDLDEFLDDARVGLAEMAEDREDFREAFAQLLMAVEEAPTPSMVYVILARLYVKVGDQAAALESYREAVRLDPSNYESYLALGDILGARSLLRGSLQDRRAAAAMFREAEDVCRIRLRGVDDRRLHLAMAKAISGQVRLLQDRDLKDAIEQLNLATDLDPDDSEPVLLKAEFFRRMGDMTEAERILVSAVKRWKTPEVWKSLHDLSKERGEFGQALQALEDGIRENAEDAGLRINLVGYLVERGDFERAEKEAEAAEALLGRDFRIHEARGDLARERSRVTEAGTEAQKKFLAQALESYATALELRPGSLRLKKKVAAELIEGVVNREAGSPLTAQEKRARQYIEDVLLVNPRDSEALTWRSRLLLVERDYAKVVEILEPALTAVDPPLGGLRLLGAAALEIGRRDLAADAFLMVVERSTRRMNDRQRDDSKASAGDWLNAVRGTSEAGRLPLALKLVRDGAKAWPGNVALRRFLGYLHLRLGEPVAAVTQLEAARKTFEDDAQLSYLLAEAYEGIGNLARAEAELKDALARWPDDRSRSKFFAFLARTGKADQAEEGFLALISGEPDDPAGYLRLGDFYMSLPTPRPVAALKQYGKGLDLCETDEEKARIVLRIAEVHLVTANTDAEQFVLAEDAVNRYAELSRDGGRTPYLRGKLALAAGEYDDAVAHLSPYVVDRPKEAAARFYLARALRASGRLEEARPHLDEAVRLDPDNRRTQVELAILQHELGVKAFQQGDFSRARDLFAQAEAGGARMGSKLFIAGAQANSGAFGLSEEMARSIVEEEPSNRAALHLLASLLLRKGEKPSTEEAETTFRKLLDLDATDLLAELGIATCRFQIGLFEEALAGFRGAYPRTQGDPGVAMAMAQCMVFLKDAVGALAFLDGEILAHPDSDAFVHLKGDFLVYMKQVDDAVPVFLSAYAKNPENFGALLAAAAALTSGGRLEEARKLLVENRGKTKRPALLRVALGDVLIHMGRIDEAEQELSRALVDEPNHPRALMLLARIAGARGNFDDARRLYRDTIARGSGDPEARTRLAQILVGLDPPQTQEAIELYRDALKLQPRDPVSLNNLADLLGRDDRTLDEAIAAAERALPLTESPYVRDTLGWLLFRAGKLERAVILLGKAAVVLEKNARVQFHAGMAYSRSGDTVDSVLHLERALRIDPDFPDAEAARNELDRLQ